MGLQEDKILIVPKKVKAIAIADLFGLGVKTKLPGECLGILGKVGAFFPQNEPTHETWPPPSMALGLGSCRVSSL